MIGKRSRQFEQVTRQERIGSQFLKSSSLRQNVFTGWAGDNNRTNEPVDQNNDMSLLTDFTSKQLEEKVTSFIRQKLSKCRLLEQVSQVNQKVEILLTEINLLPDPTASHAFLTRPFSNQEEQKWACVELFLASIYDADSGYLKQLQDIFLFNLDNQQLGRLVDREQLSFSEEFFLRRLLLTSYLVVFRQSVDPFWVLDEKLLLKFQTERARYLEQVLAVGVDEKVVSANVSSELAFLRRQNSNRSIGGQFQGGLTRKQLQERWSSQQQSTTVYEQRLKVRSGTLDEAETYRYLSSTIGYRVGLAVEKDLRTTITRVASLLATCLPSITAGNFDDKQLAYDCTKGWRIAETLVLLQARMCVQYQRASDYGSHELSQELSPNGVLARSMSTLLTSWETTSEQLLAKLTRRKTILVTSKQTTGSQQEQAAVLKKTSVSCKKNIEKESTHELGRSPNSPFLTITERKEKFVVWRLSEQGEISPGTPLRSLKVNRKLFSDEDKEFSKWKTLPLSEEQPLLSSTGGWPWKGFAQGFLTCLGLLEGYLLLRLALVVFARKRRQWKRRRSSRLE